MHLFVIYVHVSTWALRSLVPRPHQRAWGGPLAWERGFSLSNLPKGRGVEGLGTRLGETYFVWKTFQESQTTGPSKSFDDVYEAKLLKFYAPPEGSLQSLDWTLCSLMGTHL